MPKTIVVVGATGNQGGSVARTLLQDPAAWHVRALTRDPSRPAALALAAAGARVVAADLDDPASLRRAFAGAHAVFAVSDPVAVLTAGPDRYDVKPRADENLLAWAAARERQQLQNAADAAAAVEGLERFVVSVLQDTGVLSGGKYKQVYHFESKAKAEAYIKATHPALWKKTSTYVAGWFLSNILPGGLQTPQKRDDGALLFSPGIKPTTRVPVFAAEEDAGPIVEALIKEPTGGKKVLGERDSLTFAAFLELFTQTTGVKAQYVAPPAEPAELPLPEFLQGPISEMNAFWDEFGYLGGDASVISAKDLTYPPVLETVAQYLQKKTWE